MTRTNPRSIRLLALALTLAIPAVLGVAGCQQPPAVTGMGSGFTWTRISAHASGRSVYYGTLNAAANNTGPMVLIVPGGGGQVSQQVRSQAIALAAEGLRPVLACIATVTGMWAPNPATSCPGTPAATGGSTAAGREVQRVVSALRTRFPSLATNPRNLVLLGDSYGGAAVLHAAEIFGLPHPVLTVNGANTWRGAQDPVVPHGDRDPAEGALLSNLQVPVVQVTGNQDTMVPPAVAATYRSYALTAGKQVSVVTLRGADHLGPIVAPAHTCWSQQVAGIARSLSTGTVVNSRTSC